MLRLPLTTAYYRLLPLTTAYYRLLPPTTAHYRLLPLTTAYYRLLPLTTAYYCLLLLLITGCCSEAWRHYEYFRSHLGSYEKDMQTDLDWTLETRMRVFDETGKTPVLLSMLILVLGAHGQTGGHVTLPASIYELYSFAIDAVRHTTRVDRMYLIADIVCV